MSDPLTMTLDAFAAYDDCETWPCYVVRYAGTPVGKVWAEGAAWCFYHEASGITASKLPTREFAAKMIGEMESRYRRLAR